MLHQILIAYNLNPNVYKIDTFGSGLINHTWKITGPTSQYILQRINKDVFQKPLHIAENVQLLEMYLKKHAPDYLFAAPIPASNSEYMICIDNNYFRLSPFVNNSHTLNFLTQSTEAYEAARQFGKFTYLLHDFDVSRLKYTLTDFHNLTLRINLFKLSMQKADKLRLQEAREAIKQVKIHREIGRIYERIVNENNLPLRVIHHDTKISNVLFDADGKGLCVIDLDTVMPGYFISDIGDMMRTYLSEANEEENDHDKIIVREDFFAAIYAGYTEQMGSVLYPAEKELFIYAGKFMIYMQAIRFLTDFLNGDTYYPTTYPGQNWPEPTISLPC
jgi:thiamine kinase-like enzyme